MASLRGVAAALNGAFDAEMLIERRKMALIFKEPALVAAFRANTRVWADGFVPMFARAEVRPRSICRTVLPRQRHLFLLRPVWEYGSVAVAEQICPR